MGNCEYHGYSERVMVSPDLANQINSPESNRKFKVLELSYDYKGEIVEVFYLSKEFSEEYKILKFDSVPLPDFYPEWADLLEPVCLTCLESLTLKTLF